MEPAAGEQPDPIDRLILNLRAYLQQPPPRAWHSDRKWDSQFSVTFDTETTTDPSQRLRFGAYQVRHRDKLIERGVFYATDLPAGDLDVLRATFAQVEPTEAGEVLMLRTRAEFVEEILYKWGYEVGGLIIGFNLPFDLSRIAVAHTHAKGAFKGGFSFTLAEGRPNVRIKHLSQRAAFIDFAGKDGDDKRPDRGFFVDVKTLAGALMSQSVTLGSLAKLLGTTPKTEVETYAGPLTPEIVRYGMNDVHATWECFAKLVERYEGYALEVAVEGLYSEASLGKAFLSAMNVKPWREVQPKFPPHIIGQIMSTYFGGRAEVHIRREITPVIHCDFLSMYPTVCTLMGLWQFVIADGMTWSDTTAEVRTFVEGCTLEDLRRPETWRQLACIVQIRPDDDILPVRAAYAAKESPTIGLNYLTANEPMWFTLADVLAAKMLGGKVPHIISALRFAPGKPQPELKSIELAGVAIRPAFDDFYKLLIDQRRRVQEAEKAAAAADKPALKSGQQSLKILANSTSYGIFVEINVETFDQTAKSILFDHRGVGRQIKTSKIEKPGRHFHPLLATLITGAARLMLGLAERGALDQGLDWAFCDTDSLAIANTAVLPTTEFIQRVQAVCAWFEPLNPYDVQGSILQLEKVDFPIGSDGDLAKLRPVNCLAISAKRYVLFDRAEDGDVEIRKASRHGLGHLLAPYPDPDKGGRMDRLGVELWQEDLWKAIIAAFDAGKPDQVDYGGLRNFDQPAASRFGATNQTTLKWFSKYNETVPAAEAVWPFNFLLTFQCKSSLELADADPQALWTPSGRLNTSKLASRYSSDLINDQPPVFNRTTGALAAWSRLKTYGRALVRHHLHSEMKFLGGEDDARGVLRRRHVHAWAIIPIGKEADNLDETETIGADDDDTIERPLGFRDRDALTSGIEAVLRTYRISDAKLLREAAVSPHTLRALRSGGRVSQQSLLSLARAAEDLRRDAIAVRTKQECWRQVAFRVMIEVGGRNRFAALLGLSAPYVGRVVSGEKPMSREMINLLQQLQVARLGSERKDGRGPDVPSQGQSHPAKRKAV